MARPPVISPEPPRGSETSGARGADGRIIAFLRRAAIWVVPGSNPVDAVYGIVTVGALLAAEGAIHETYPETVGSVAIVMSLYGFAHVYAELLGTRLTAQARPGRELWGPALVRGLAVLEGASLPLVTLLVAWISGVALGDATTAAIWTAVASLIVLELAAGILSRSRPVQLVIDACVGAAMGLGILALKALVA
jgi:hypothetical protein